MDSEVFKLNLDSKEFIDSIKKSQEALEGLGASSESLKAIISHIGTATKLLGTMAIAYAAVKSAVDWVEEAEQLKQISNQFDLLTSQAGIAGSTLKKSFNTTELLKLANKGIVELGDNAQRLPEILNLARKVGSLFGGDLTSNFENITQAISSGNVRALKHMGIIVDTNKAYIEYGKSIGTTVDQLSQSGKQAALMNAVLEKGGEQFKNVNANGLETKATMKTIGIQIKELGEIFVTVFEKSAGPLVRSVLNSVKEFSQYVKEKALANMSSWGENAEASAAQIKGLEEKLVSLHERQKSLNEKQAATGFAGFFIDKKQVEIYQKETVNAITAAEAEIQGLRAVSAANETAAAKKAADAPQNESDDKIKLDAKIAHQTEYQKELITLQAATLKAQEENERTLADVERDHEARKVQMQIETSQKMAEIELKRAQDKLTGPEALAIEEQVMMAHNEKMASLDENLWDRKVKAMENFAIHSQSASDQFAAGWKQSSLTAVKDADNFSKMGQTAFTTVGSRATAAFKSIGAGSASASQAMKTFFLGALGDMASKQGELLLMKGIALTADPTLGPGGPVLMAEGAGLIALGGLLGAASGATSGLGGGGSGGGLSPSIGGMDSSGVPSAAHTEKKTVTVQVMGHVFETDQTKRIMMDLIRQETDATDFKYQQIGV